MTDEHRLDLVPAMRYPASWEAELAVARLEAAGIPAAIRGNDIVGIFGPGFAGATARGVDVLVPREALEAAREILGD